MGTFWNRRRGRPSTTGVVESFITSVRGRGCSPAYEHCRYTLGFLARAEQLLPVRPEPLEAVLAGLGHYSDSTRHDVWCAFRLLYRHASDRFGVVNAAAAVARPPRRPKVKRTLNYQELDLLLATARAETMPGKMLTAPGGQPYTFGDRNHALIRLLLDTGARLGEVATLTAADVRVEDVDGEVFHSVRVSGKTGEREVPVTRETYTALERLAGADAQPLWWGQQGPLTVAGVQDVVERALKAAGLEGGPHMLRHTYGTLYTENGGDVFSLMRVMGHASIETTKQYVHLDRRAVRSAHIAFSPAARAT